MESNEVPDLGVVKSVTELILQCFEGVESVFFKVQNGFLSFKGFLIESDDILRAELGLELLVVMVSIQCTLTSAE